MKAHARIEGHELHTRLPKGHRHCYISGFSPTEDGGDFTGITVTDWNTGETLFTSRDGSGDYRGYPANIHAAIAIDLYERHANGPLGEEEFDWHDVATHYEADLEDDPALHAPQFVLKPRPGGRTFPEGDPANDWIFTGWLPPTDTFDEAGLQATEEAIGEAIR